MDIRHLKYFIEIVKENGFTAASEKLYVSQSSISKAISKIEKELGYELFDPKQKRPVLNTAGQRFYEKSVQLVKDYDKFLDESKSSTASVSGAVTVGIPPLISTCYFAPIIASFTNDFPKAEVKLVEDGSISIQNSVDKELIDVGIVILPVYGEKFDIVNLVSDNTVLVVPDSHPLSGQNEATYDDLRSERLILFNKEYTLYHQITANCRNAGFEPLIVLTSGSWDYITELVSLKHGITVMPRPIFEKRAYRGITTLNLKGDNISWNVVLITKKGIEPSNIVKSFVNYTKSYFSV